MSYGFSSTNPGGQLIIDSSHSIYRVLSTGSIIIQQNPWSGATPFEAVALFPQVLMDALVDTSKDVLFSFPTEDLTQYGSIKYPAYMGYDCDLFLIGSHRIGAYIDYVIMDNDYTQVSNNEYGLALWDATGKKIFQSTEDIFIRTASNDMLDSALLEGGVSGFMFPPRVITHAVPVGKKIYIHANSLRTSIGAVQHSQNRIGYSGHYLYTYGVYSITSTQLTMCVMNYAGYDEYFTATADDLTYLNDPDTLRTTFITGYIA